MNKLIIHLVASFPEVEFDVFVPDDLPVCDLVQLFQQAIYSMYGNRRQMYGGELLCAAREKKVLAPEGTLSAYGIQNGDILYLL